MILKAERRNLFCISISFYLNPFLMLFQILIPNFIFCQLLGKTYYRIHICFHFDLFLVHILLIKEHSLLFVHWGIGLENSLSNVANLSQGKLWLRKPINLVWKVIWEEGIPFDRYGHVDPWAAVICLNR